jgi:hypothetical protein
VVVANQADKTFDQANVNVDFLAADGGCRFRAARRPRAVPSAKNNPAAGNDGVTAG